VRPTLLFAALVLVLASVTDSLITAATHVINHLGLPGVALLCALDSMGVPIAAAVIMLFAGFNISDPQSQHHFSLIGVIAAGVIGDVIGSTIAYWIGYFGRTELLEKHGRKLHVTPQRLALVERWFDRYGMIVIPVGRFIPVVRTFIGYPAGAARMPYGRFIALTALGALALSALFASIGKAVGTNWTHWRHTLGYLDYVVVVAIVAGIGYWLYTRRRRDGDDAGEPAVDAGT
jgi:membrane protein DedA with SNARE-associated domain